LLSQAQGIKDMLEYEVQQEELARERDYKERQLAIQQAQYNSDMAYKYTSS
jgi:hypothetical protein